MDNKAKYKIEVYCNGELQVTTDSPNAEEDVALIKRLLQEPEEMARARRILRIAHERKPSRIPRELSLQVLTVSMRDRGLLAEGKTLCLPCYGMHMPTEQKSFAASVQKLLPPELVAVFDLKKPGTLHIVRKDDGRLRKSTGGPVAET